MKAVLFCDHLDEEYVNERRKKWLDKSDDGHFSIILDCCKECFIQQALPLYDADTHVIDYKGTESTLAEYVDSNK